MQGRALGVGVQRHPHEKVKPGSEPKEQHVGRTFYLPELSLFTEKQFCKAYFVVASLCGNSVVRWLAQQNKGAATSQFVY